MPVLCRLNGPTSRGECKPHQAGRQSSSVFTAVQHVPDVRRDDWSGAYCEDDFLERPRTSHVVGRHSSDCITATRSSQFSQPKRTRGVRCRNVWKFSHGLKFTADFHSKMSVCRHELGGWTLGNSNPESSLFQTVQRRPIHGLLMFVLDYKLSTNYVDSFPAWHHTGCQHSLHWLYTYNQWRIQGAPIRPCPGPPPPQIGVATGALAAWNYVTYRHVVRHAKQNYVTVNTSGPILWNRLLLHHIKFYF